MVANRDCGMKLTVSELAPFQLIVGRLALLDVARVIV